MTFFHLFSYHITAGRPKRPTPLERAPAPSVSSHSRNNSCLRQADANSRLKSAVSLSPRASNCRIPLDSSVLLRLHVCYHRRQLHAPGRVGRSSRCGWWACVYQRATGQLSRLAPEKDNIAFARPPRVMSPGGGGGRSHGANRRSYPKTKRECRASNIRSLCHNANGRGE